MILKKDFSSFIKVIIFGIITGIIAYKLEDFVFTKKEKLHKKSY